MTTDDDSMGAPDLDVWRAEAGDCAPLDAAATPDWTQAHHIDEPRAVVSLDDMNLSLLALDRDGMAIFDRVEDARFAVAARTGWPRDAARVAALVDRVAALEAHVATLEAVKAIGDRQETLADRFAARCEALEAALLDAAAFIEPPPNAYLSPSVLFAARDKAAELRAIAAGTSATTGEEPAR
jgi:hypothetical protein